MRRDQPGPSAQAVLSQVRSTPAYKNGLKIGKSTYKIKIVVQDSQSDPNRASTVARQLILQNKVDMILTTSTPETTNPVAAAAEKLGTPCLSTVVPWESWYAGLGGNPHNPTTTFKYSTMFFFGLKEFQGCFAPMWNRFKTNKVVACQYPNDSDGTAFREGFEPLIKASGYKAVDGGAYQDGISDFTSMTIIGGIGTIGGTDHRHDRVLRAAADPFALRDVVFHHPGPAGDGDRHLGPPRALGTVRGPLAHPAFPGGL